MVRVLYPKHLRGRTLVDQQTYSQFGGWVPLVSWAGSELVVGHNYVFLATGLMGSAVRAPTIQTARAEVAITQAAGASFAESVWQHFPVANGILDGSNGCAQPFTMLWRVDGWASNSSVELSARVFLNTDPFPDLAAFEVSDLTLLAFDLTELGSTRFLWDAYANNPPTGTALASTASGGTQWRMTSAPSYSGSGTDAWLAFFSHQCYHVAPDNLPRFEHGTVQNLTWGTFSRLNSWASRCAIPRISDGALGVAVSRQHVGQVIPVGIANATTELAVIASDEGPNPSRAFAVRTTTFAFRADFLYGHARNTMGDALGFYGLLGSAGTPLEQLMTAEEVSQLVGIYCGHPKTRAGRNVGGGTLDLDFASRRVSLPASQQLNPIAIEVAGIPARDPQIVVNSGLTAYRDTGRVQVAGRGNLAFGDAGGDIVSAFYAIQAMGTDTPPSSGTIETPGPVVVIHPAREAPSLGSLPVLPVTPDEPVVLSWDSEEHAIETLNLHRITIPRFLKHGRAVRFQFGGLTYAQAETLAAFLATNSGAFRHQWKGWAEVAWRAIPSTWQTRGGDGVLLAASFEAIELRFVGP